MSNKITKYLSKSDLKKEEIKRQEAEKKIRDLKKYKLEEEKIKQEKLKENEDKQRIDFRNLIGKEILKVDKFCTNATRGNLMGLSYQTILLFLFYAYKLDNMAKKLNKKPKSYIHMIEIFEYFPLYESRYLRWLASDELHFDNYYVLTIGDSDSFLVPFRDLYNNLVKLADKINKVVSFESRYAIIVGEEYENELMFNPNNSRFHILRMIWNKLIYKPLFIIGKNDDFVNVQKFRVTDNLDFIIIINEYSNDKNVHSLITDKLQKTTIYEFILFDNYKHFKKDYIYKQNETFDDYMYDKPKINIIDNITDSIPLEEPVIDLFKESDIIYPHLNDRPIELSIEFDKELSELD